MKKLSTSKQKATAHSSPTPTTINKTDCLEEKVKKLCKNDQVIHENEIFATRQFSVIQKIYDQKKSNHTQACCS